MIIVTDRDRELGHEITDMLRLDDIQPWQRKVLELMLAMHRESQPRVFGYNRNVPTSAPVRMNDQIEGRCNTPAPPESGAPWTRCVEKGPHQFHYTGAYRWRSDALGVLCGVRMPDTTNVYCTLPVGHREVHKHKELAWP